MQNHEATHFWGSGGLSEGVRGAENKSTFVLASISRVPLKVWGFFSYQKTLQNINQDDISMMQYSSKKLVVGVTEKEIKKSVDDVCA